MSGDLHSWGGNEGRRYNSKGEYSILLMISFIGDFSEKEGKAEKIILTLKSRSSVTSMLLLTNGLTTHTKRDGESIHFIHQLHATAAVYSSISNPQTLNRDIFYIWLSSSLGLSEPLWSIFHQTSLGMFFLPTAATCSWEVSFLWADKGNSSPSVVKHDPPPLSLVALSSSQSGMLSSDYG